MYSTRTREDDMVGLVQALKSSEIEQTNTLVELMSQAKTGRRHGLEQSMNSLIRGLYTKNNKLVSMLRKTVVELEKNHVEQKDIFKTFVTEFIKWMENDGVVLLEKYFDALQKAMSDDAVVVNWEASSQPIVNCHNYVKFVEDTGTILRNPYVVEKLSAISKRLQSILDSFYKFRENRKLSNIGFEDVRPFSISESSNERVSSYFDISRIVDRSANEMMFTVVGDSRIRCELVLLNLSCNEQILYDALAILSVDANELQPRSLIYPPFRVNELSLSYSHSKMYLKPLDFSSRQNSSKKLVIEFSQRQALTQWCKKLSEIFPTEQTDSPMSETFLIKSPITASFISGLGINIVSDNDKDVNYLDLGAPPSASPSLHNVARSPTIQSTASSPLRHATEALKIYPSANDNDMYHQPRFPDSTSSVCSSATYQESCELDKAQYDRSVDLIHKTLSSIHSNHSHTSIAPSQSYHLKSVNSSAVDLPHQSDTPQSSSAEVENSESGSLSSPEDITKAKSEESDPSLAENYLSSERLKFQSAPNLTETNPKEKVFQLATGSVVDISNFGKNFKPSFSIAKDLSDLTKPTEGEGEKPKAKPKKKSILKLFGRSKDNKKDSNKNSNDMNSSSETLVKHENTSSSKKNTNVNNLTIDTSKKVDGVVKSGSLSAQSQPSPGTNKAKPTSTGPSAFVLPSVDSDWNVASIVAGSKNAQRDHKDNSPKFSDDIQEEDLNIPQDTKDIINADSSIDFYISPSESKAIKVTKWRQKHGKWKMLTMNENLFMKIVVNYEAKKGWIIIFKEELDEEYNEVIDKPVLLLDLLPKHTRFGQSSALDIQIDSTNSINSKDMLILIRCASGSLANAIHYNLKNSLHALESHSHRYRSIEDSKQAESDMTIASSMMEHQTTSNSSTLMSIYSPQQHPKSPAEMKKDLSSYSIRSSDIENANILNNPENEKWVILDELTIRLQKQMASFESINDLSSWKVLSMYNLSIQFIQNSCSNEDYFNIILHNENENEHAIIDFNWLIKKKDIGERVQKIGKAGLLVMVDDKNLYLIECKGKKEFKLLYDVLV